MISHRPPTAADRAFIVSAWSSSYKLAHAAGMIHTEDWPAVMHRQIDRVLDRPDASTFVAFESRSLSPRLRVETSAADFLYGFISGDTSGREPVVFYCYVKEPYRRMGLARGLFAALGVDPQRHFAYACKTALVSRLADKIPLAKWKPAIARYPKNQPQE